MEKFLREFEDKSSYITDKGNINRPGVSLINNTMEVIYDPFIPPAVQFTAEEDNSSVGLEKLSTNQTLEYSTNGVDWSDMNIDTLIELPNIGDKVYIRGVLNGDNAEEDYTQFKMTGKIAARGNCNSLWNYENLDAPLKQYCGFNLFWNCISLVSTPELPATDLAPYCYAWLLQNTSITTAPELPANILHEHCYEGLFCECTSLATVPELPATDLTPYCYYYMFYGCTSLTTAPELPATTLASYCYYRMFYGCTSLTTATELPATTLADHCYGSMFHSCTSLTNVPSTMLPATTLERSCYSYMFYGCTSLLHAPELPAIELAESCYESLFSGCISLLERPNFVATKLANRCYAGMLHGTGYLPDVTNIDFESNEVAQEGILSGLFDGTPVTDEYLRSILPINPETDNYWLPAQLKWGKSGYWRMFADCTLLRTAPELPSTELGRGCYNQMFAGCTSLEVAPDLNVEILVGNCYWSMFKKCSSLKRIKCLATDISAETCINDWTWGVSSEGTFIKNPAMNSWRSGSSGIPSGWTVVDDE